MSMKMIWMITVICMMKMIDKKDSELIQYRNKINGDTFDIPVNARKFYIEGREYVEFFSKNRRLKIATDSLEKVI